MSCDAPIGEDRLWAFWLDELAEPETDAIEDHVFECESCLRMSGEIGELVRTVRNSVPVSLTARAVDVLRKRMRLLETVALRDTRADAVWTPDIDLMVHRLKLPEGYAEARITVEVCWPTDMTPYLTFNNVVFDRERGELNLVCHRHYYDLFNDERRDARFRVRLETPTGEQVADYQVVHDRID